jgi:uncharacterized Zn-binding protein involved in type VI secretion
VRESAPAARKEDTVKHDQACGKIVEGHRSTVIENALAARLDDRVDHGDAKLVEGSATVYVGGRPAARRDDASSCEGKVDTHAKRTILGGPKTRR